MSPLETLNYNPLTNTSTIGRAGVDHLTVASNVTFSGGVTGLNKSHVGLANVDNTCDLNKPISISTQSALNLKANQMSMDIVSSNANTPLSTTNSELTTLKTDNTASKAEIASRKSTMAETSYVDTIISQPLFPPRLA